MPRRKEAPSEPQAAEHEESANLRQQAAAEPFVEPEVDQTAQVRCTHS